jgi:hypothetical protein
MAAAARRTQRGTADRRCRHRRSARLERGPSRRKLLRIPRRNRGVARPEEVARDDVLALGCVEIVDVRLRDGSGPLTVDDGIDQRDGRLGQNADGRPHDVESVGTHLAAREQRFVLPGEQHVADTTLHERVRGRTSARVLHGNMAVDVTDEFFGLGLRRGDLVGRQGLETAEIAAQRALEREAPRGEVVPACTARGLRVRRDDIDVVTQQVGPVADALRIALADEEHDRRRVGRAVVRQA